MPNDQLQQRSNDSIKTIRHLLESRRDAFAEVLPKHLNPERLVKIAIIAITKTPKLLECRPESLVLSVANAAEVGLEPTGGVLGQGYLVPFWNTKHKCFDAQFMPGYRGLIDLAMRSGDLRKIEARVVYEGDEFDVSYGTAAAITHRPASPDDRGGVKAVYAVATSKDGTAQFDVMWQAEIEKVRSASKSADAGPWVEWWEEMAKKTVIKRLCKLLRMSTELAKAIEHDNAAQGFGEIDVTPREARPKPRRRSEMGLTMPTEPTEPAEPTEPPPTEPAPPAPADSSAPSSAPTEKPNPHNSPFDGEKDGSVLTIFAKIIRITPKKGTNAKGEFTRHEVEIETGEKFSTFLEDVANQAAAAYNAGSEAEITYKVQGKYRNLVSVKV